MSKNRLQITLIPFCKFYQDFYKSELGASHTDYCQFHIDDDTGVGFEVLTAASMNMAVFWVVTPCSLVEVYQCFRGNF
jgi:hypothetical protein